MLNDLPACQSPKEAPFENGLYFFYQDGELSKHAPKGCVVRVGNHPRSQDGLQQRLQMHYNGNKNSSVFRKSLGGAIIRSSNPNDPCLAPAPGKGHWEKQDAKACPQCRPVENEVSHLLQSKFCFRCIRIDDVELRNQLERKLIATLAQCPTCIPSDLWLGRYAYSEKVQRTGLWNSDHVDGPTMDSEDMAAFSRAVEAAFHAFEGR